ncbi:MAG TPA: hypothetical protein VFK56_05205 [Mycobacterium sp.]|nr:hypothetical protein [Mycobacterium sp.]
MRHVVECCDLDVDAGAGFDGGAGCQAVVAARESGRFDNEVEVAESGGEIEHCRRRKRLRARLELLRFYIVADADASIQLA